MPEISLTDAIGANSPIRLKRRVTRFLAQWIVTDESYNNTGQIHSTAKIELFYKPIIWIFIIAFLSMFLGGAVLFDRQILLEICTQKISSFEWPKLPQK